jgi:hypothetical protein
LVFCVYYLTYLYYTSLSIFFNTGAYFLSLFSFLFFFSFPLRPLVRRAPRAGVRAPDQRFLIPALVGDASFSGGFLGALSTLRRACHGKVARRVWPLSCGFAAVGELRRPGEVVLRVRA